MRSVARAANGGRAQRAIQGQGAATRGTFQARMAGAQADASHGSASCALVRGGVLELT